MSVLNPRMKSSCHYQERAGSIQNYSASKTLDRKNIYGFMDGFGNFSKTNERTSSVLSMGMAHPPLKVALTFAKYVCKV